MCSGISFLSNFSSILINDSHTTPTVLVVMSEAKTFPRARLPLCCGSCEGRGVFDGFCGFTILVMWYNGIVHRFRTIEMLSSSTVSRVIGGVSPEPSALTSSLSTPKIEVAVWSVHEPVAPYLATAATRRFASRPCPWPFVLAGCQPMAVARAINKSTVD